MAFTSSHIIRSGAGWRVTYMDRGEPVLSLWGDAWLPLAKKARDMLRATPEPIDAILQATLWHGKAAQA